MDTDYDEPIKFDPKPKLKRSSVTYGKKRGQQPRDQASTSSSGARVATGSSSGGTRGTAEIGKRRRDDGETGEDEDADAESNSSDAEEREGRGKGKTQKPHAPKRARHQLKVHASDPGASTSTSTLLDVPGSTHTRKPDGQENRIDRSTSIKSAREGIPVGSAHSSKTNPPKKSTNRRPASVEPNLLPSTNRDLRDDAQMEGVEVVREKGVTQSEASDGARRSKKKPKRAPTPAQPTATSASQEGLPPTITRTSSSQPTPQIQTETRAISSNLSQSQQQLLHLQKPVLLRDKSNLPPPRSSTTSTTGRATAGAGILASPIHLLGSSLSVVGPRRRQVQAGGETGTGVSGVPQSPRARLSTVLPSSPRIEVFRDPQSNFPPLASTTQRLTGNTRVASLTEPPTSNSNLPPLARRHSAVAGVPSISPFPSMPKETANEIAPPLRNLAKVADPKPQSQLALSSDAFTSNPQKESQAGEEAPAVRQEVGPEPSISRGGSSIILERDGEVDRITEMDSSIVVETFEDDLIGSKTLVEAEKNIAADGGTIDFDLNKAGEEEMEEGNLIAQMEIANQAKEIAAVEEEMGLGDFDMGDQAGDEQARENFQVDTEPLAKRGAVPPLSDAGGDDDVGVETDSLIPLNDILPSTSPSPRPRPPPHPKSSSSTVRSRHPNLSPPSSPSPPLPPRSARPLTDRPLSGGPPSSEDDLAYYIRTTDTGEHDISMDEDETAEERTERESRFRAQILKKAVGGRKTQRVEEKELDQLALRWAREKLDEDEI